MTSATFSIGALVALSCAAFANDGSQAEVLDATFTNQSEQVFDLLGGESVKGLDRGAVSLRVDVQLPDDFPFGETSFDAYSRFAPHEVHEGQQILPWEPIAGQVTLLELSKGSNTALLAVELGVGDFGKTGGFAGQPWPMGPASLELAIGVGGGLKLDDEGEVVGAFSNASLDVEAKYPAVFAVADNAVPSALTSSFIQVVRTEAGTKQALVVEVLDNDGVYVDGDKATAFTFGINQHVTELPLATMNSDGFRLRLSDVDGNVLFTSDLIVGESRMVADDQHLAQTLPNTGAVTYSSENHKGDPVLGPPIPLKLYSYCVPPVIHDHGASYLTQCGGCSTALNPPAPNCPAGGKWFFYTAGHCKSSLFTLGACIEADETVERSGPLYMPAGEVTTTQGCWQFSVSLSYIIGGGASRPRRQTCCNYQRCDMDGPTTKTMRTCRD